MPTLFMETTRINPERTISEIQSVLMAHGASSIMMEYKNKQSHALSFKIDLQGNLIPFCLPCRWQELEILLKKQGRRPKFDDTWETWARRVAWRQILRWVEAQFALVETGMVKVEEVFLPYMQTKSGQTVFEITQASNFLMLENS